VRQLRAFLRSAFWWQWLLPDLVDGVEQQPAAAPALPSLERIEIAPQPRDHLRALGSNNSVGHQVQVVGTVS
jgi:hypothetical protein